MTKSNIVMAIETLDKTLDSNGEITVEKGRRSIGLVATKGIVECRFSRSLYLGGAFGEDVMSYSFERACLLGDGDALKSNYSFTSNPNNRQFSVNHNTWLDCTRQPKPGVCLGGHTDYSYFKLTAEEVERIANNQSVNAGLDNFRDFSRYMFTLAHNFYFTSPEIPSIKTKAQLGRAILNFL